jgi:hypothetical protein
MRLKYIKLFEDLEESPTWSTIRDTIQNRKSFAIFVFEDEESLSKFREEKLTDSQSINQLSYSRQDGELSERPSLFYLLDKNTNLTKQIKTLFKEYSIINIVYGEENKDFSKVYFKDGEVVSFGNELISDLSQDRIAVNFYFKIDAIYYTFFDYSNY